MSGRFKPPDVEESVACNLIPMIDIMFLLLLFFMLGADMTQRELEDVELPKADQVKEESKEKEGGTIRATVNIYHKPESNSFSCATHVTHGICREKDHWLISVRSQDYNLDTIKEKLDTEAARDLEPADVKGAKRLSKIEVMIRADQSAPYGFIQRVIESCGAVGIYKIAVGAARPDAGP